MGLGGISVTPAGWGRDESSGDARGSGDEGEAGNPVVQGPTEQRQAGKDSWGLIHCYLGLQSFPLQRTLHPKILQAEASGTVVIPLFNFPL